MTPEFKKKVTEFNQLMDDLIDFTLTKQQIINNHTITLWKIK